MSVSLALTSLVGLSLLCSWPGGGVVVGGAVEESEDADGVAVLFDGVSLRCAGLHIHPLRHFSFSSLRTGVDN
jgi:hypothetical protein